MAANLKSKIGKIKLMAVDVDGVLTDGSLVYDSRGKELKVFCVQDGLGLVALAKAGIKTAIISAKSAAAVRVRARELGIGRIYQNAHPKIDAYGRLLKDLKLKDEEVGFIGDDLTDLAILERVGFAVAVGNAAAEVKKVADYVTRKNGGQGAVREVAELILKKQGKWAAIIRGYASQENK